MGVAERHSDVAVTEEPGDDRHRDSAHDRMTGHCVSQVMEAHILDPRIPAYRIPQAIHITAWTPETAWRGKHECTISAGLALENTACPGIQGHRPGTGLAVGKDQGIAMEFRPAKIKDFPPAASGQQEQTNDVGLLPVTRAIARIFIQRPVQAPDLVPGQESGHRASAVGPDGQCGGGFDVAVRHREVQDMPKGGECGVGAAGCGPAVGIEPAQHLLAGDPVEWRCAEGGQEL